LHIEYTIFLFKDFTWLLYYLDDGGRNLFFLFKLLLKVYGDHREARGRGQSLDYLVLNNLN